MLSLGAADCHPEERGPESRLGRIPLRPGDTCDGIAGVPSGADGTKGGGWQPDGGIIKTPHRAHFHLGFDGSAFGLAQAPPSES